ncbi:chromate transporter [Mycoplasma crocodyli]|uniref:Chromate ion transporter n=1 Tax=Mycoplasma crocodyli (strain ATCC 51981 / MP145) TaxID=512564 RepID=D5E648_MYCCM|nr:chromate transporter [Mycoplasma crocodyli]ADE19668.1 chromate ion transporter [Mycoplasma crocodyli MP145]
MIALLVSIPILILISLSVFGGGQVFMPIFKWFWELLAKLFQSDINQDTINRIFTISNATPGVVSTKFSFFTGYIIANGSWWGYLAMFLTYFVFCLPAIFVMLVTMKYINKFEDKLIVKKLMLYMKPIVAGIIFSIAIQLILSIMFPYIYFNEGINKYVGLNFNDQKALFFSGWRRLMLYAYFPTMTIISIYLSHKKTPLFWIILLGLVSSLICFMPWL